MPLYGASQYGRGQYGAGSNRAVTKVFSFKYDVQETVTQTFSFSYDVPLENTFSFSYDVASTARLIIPFSYNVGQAVNPVTALIPFSYDVNELVRNGFAFSYDVLAHQEFSIVYDVGNWARMQIPIRYDVYGRVEQTFDFSYDVTPVVVVGTFPFRYDVGAFDGFPGTTIPIEGEYGDSGGRSLTPFEPEEPTEDDNYGFVSASFDPLNPTGTLAAGSVSIAMELFVYNNNCASIYAERMLNVGPSAYKDAAWDSEYTHQLTDPSTLDLLNLDGDVELSLARHPGDMTFVGDIGVRVSGLSEDGYRLPRDQKRLILSHGQAPFDTVEAYVGTTSEIAAQIVSRSRMVTLNHAQVELASPVTVYDTSLTVVDNSQLPAYGYLAFNDETIWYAAKGNAGRLVGLTRGALGTMPAAHAAGDTATVTMAGGAAGSKLRNISGLAIVSDKSSNHMALWKMLGSFLCFLWTKFYDRIHSFFIRESNLAGLKKWATLARTNPWTYLRWRKIRGSVGLAYSAGIRKPTGDDRFIAISDDTYLNFQNAGIRVSERSHGLVKVGSGPVEYMYIDYVGPKSFGGFRPFQSDSRVNYVMRVVERGVEYGSEYAGPIAHSAGETIEYVPTNLTSFSNDAQLLEAVVREPTHILRERLRLSFGEKANFPSLRRMYDVLERLVPDSTIDLWDFYSTEDGDPKSDDRKFVSIDREVGWLLGVQNRTELQVNTYLGLQIYSQGYWEYVWDNQDEQSRLLKIKGRYPFFVRTKRWWYDPEMLKQVTNLMKSAGTTPNYSINGEVEVLSGHVLCEEDGIEEVMPDNWFGNPLFTQGVIFSTIDHEISDVDQDDWKWECTGTVVPERIEPSDYTQSDGTPCKSTISSTGARVTNDTGDFVLLYQVVDKVDGVQFGDQDFMAQFYVRLPGVVTVADAAAVVTAGLMSPGSDVDLSGYLQTNYIQAEDDWWLVTFAIPSANVPAGPYQVGLWIADGESVLVTGALLQLAYSGLLKAQNADTDQFMVVAESTPARFSDMPASGVVRITDPATEEFTYVKFLTKYYNSADTTKHRIVALERLYESTVGYTYPVNSVVEFVCEFSFRPLQLVPILYSKGSRKVEQKFSFSYRKVA